MTITIATLSSIQIGPIAPLGPDGVPSGFIKSTIDGAVDVKMLGLVGDEQANLTVHGGLEKAVYGYPAAHHRAWAADYPEHADKFVPGGVGENLAIEGLVEADLCVGDVHAIGSARLQVCQPRQPCAKFAWVFADKRLPKAMVRNGRAGWYYRVLEEGTFQTGDQIALVDRPNPAFRFDRLVHFVNFGDASVDELHTMAAMTALASGLRTRARQALVEGVTAPN